jgi:hypothetical protein
MYSSIKKAPEKFISSLQVQFLLALLFLCLEFLTLAKVLNFAFELDLLLDEMTTFRF